MPTSDSLNPFAFIIHPLLMLILEAAIAVAVYRWWKRCPGTGTGILFAATGSGAGAALLQLIGSVWLRFVLLDGYPQNGIHPYTFTFLVARVVAIASMLLFPYAIWTLWIHWKDQAYEREIEG